MMRILPAVLLMLPALAGCLAEPTSAEVTDEDGDIRFGARFTTGPGDERLRADAWARNDGDETVYLVWTCSPPGEQSKTGWHEELRQEGKEIQFEPPRVCPAVLHFEELGPGDNRSFHRPWNGTVFEGRADAESESDGTYEDASRGDYSYRIEFWFYSEQDDYPCCSRKVGGEHQFSI